MILPLTAALTIFNHLNWYRGFHDQKWFKRVWIPIEANQMLHRMHALSTWVLMICAISLVFRCRRFWVTGKLQVRSWGSRLPEIA